MADIPIPPKWLLFAADLLDMAAEKFGDCNCNDLPIPDDWTDDEVTEFGRAFEDWNSEGHDFNPEDPWIEDYAAMEFMAALIRKAVAIA